MISSYQKRPVGNKSTKILDRRTGIVYLSINRAARALNLSADMLGRIIKNKTQASGEFIYLEVIDERQKSQGIETASAD